MDLGLGLNNDVQQRWRRIHSRTQWEENRAVENPSAVWLRDRDNEVVGGKIKNEKNKTILFDIKHATTTTITIFCIRLIIITKFISKSKYNLIFKFFYKNKKMFIIYSQYLLKISSSKQILLHFLYP